MTPATIYLKRNEIYSLQAKPTQVANLLAIQFTSNNTKSIDTISCRKNATNT